jgi:hypothetical protein
MYEYEAVDAHTFTKKGEKFETNAECLKADYKCFLFTGKGVDGKSPVIIDQNNVTSVQ